MWYWDLVVNTTLVEPEINTVYREGDIETEKQAYRERKQGNWLDIWHGVSADQALYTVQDPNILAFVDGYEHRNGRRHNNLPSSLYHRPAQTFAKRDVSKQSLDTDIGSLWRKSTQHTDPGLQRYYTDYKCSCQHKPVLYRHRVCWQNAGPGIALHKKLSHRNRTPIG